MISPGLDNIQQSSFSYSFDYEHRVEAEYNGANNQGASGNNASSSQAAASVQVLVLPLDHFQTYD